MKSVFEYNKILDFLSTQLGDKNQRRGIKTRLTRHIGCQSSYLSRILVDKAQLTIEQAADTADFFNMTKPEKDYFLLLTQKERSGNSRLKSYFEEKIKEILNNKNNIAKRLEKNTEELPNEVAEIYYSDWVYLAIHVITSVPFYSKPKTISEHLGIPLEKVIKVLEFLVEYNFVTYEGSSFTHGPQHLHIRKESPLNYLHQVNWRLRSLEKLKEKQASNINYAAVYSLSKKDAEMLKENIINLIKKNLKKIEPSKEEVVYCSIIDFFEL